MEERIVAYLQSILDNIKETMEDKDTDFMRRSYLEMWQHAKNMTEAVTGKVVTFRNWVVFLED